MPDSYSDFLDYASEIRMLTVGLITKVKIPQSIRISQTCIRVYLYKVPRSTKLTDTERIMVAGRRGKSLIFNEYKLSIFQDKRIKFYRLIAKQTIEQMAVK